MKKFKLHKTIAFFLAVLMIFSAVPVMDLSIFAEEIDTSVYESYKGCTAKFNGYFPVPVADNPENVKNPWGTDCVQLFDDETPDDFLMVIIDYYYNTESGDLWYLVEAAPGYTSPEKLISNPWVYQDNVKNPMGDSLYIFPKEEVKDSVSITDQNGNTVETITLPQYEKPKFTAESTLEGNVSYQWQIEYGPDKWVDIYGEDSASIVITYGMVASLLKANGTVNIRCRSTSGSKVIYSANIPVTVEIYTGSTKEIITGSFVTSGGKTVSVTVSGDIPEESALDVKEAVSNDIEINASQTVTATFDISIKNVNGTEWQPESGESVEVTLSANACGLSKGDQFVIYHQHGDEVEILGPYIVNNSNITFTVDGFSQFVFALWEQSLTTEDLLSDVTKTAKINDIYDYIWLVSAPENITEYSGNWYVTARLHNDYEEDIEFTVTDVYVSSVAPYGVFYKVGIKNGTALTDIFDDYAWVFQKYLDEPDDYNTLILSDPEPEEPMEPSCDITVNGNKVSEVEVSTEVKVTVTATPSNISGSRITYQWQIFIPSANTWVNISGQTTADCTINYGMVANRLDADGKAKIRCITTVDGTEITSEPIAVNIISTYTTLTSNNTKSIRSGISPLAEGDTNGKYTVNVYYYIGDTNVMQDKVYIMQFGYTEEARDVSLDIPVKVGYKPYYFGTNSSLGKENGVLINTDKYTIENFKPTDDMTLIVRYYPNEDTPYKVEHYIQNVYDDGYMLHSTTNHIGTTDALVPDFNGDNSLVLGILESQGFYALPYKRIAIASDGGTVIQIYYDRYMYLMLFNLGDGGMGVEPVYGRHGVEYEVGTPKRLGYTFDGWEDDSGNIIGVASTGKYTFSIPARDIIYTAKWKEDDANYMIVFWRADLDDGNAATPPTYSYWGSATIGSISGTTLTPSTVGNQNPARDIKDENFDNKEASYFSYDAEITAQNNPATVTVAGDGSTIINVYYTRKIFEIRYIYARRSANSTNSTQYQIATLTNNGKVGNWTTSNGALPTLKSNADFEAKTELIRTGNTNYNYYYISVRSEYGADIESQWPADVLNPRETYSFGSWAAEDGTGYRSNDPEHANIVGSYPYMSSDMIKAGNEDIAYTDEKTGETYYVAQRMSAWWGASSSIGAHTYHIYYEVLEGTGDRQYNGKWYNLVRTLDFVAAHNGSTRVDPFYYTGYVCVNDTRGENNINLNKTTDYQKDSNNYKKGSKYYNCPDNSCQYCNCFYYDNEVNSLSFYNHNETTNAAGKTFDTAKLKFELPISEGLPDGQVAPYEPPYPEGLDIDGYVFKGWYTSPGCYDGTEVDWSSSMPAGDLTVYAKWEPVEHTIEFYFDETLAQKLEFPTQKVLHNNYGEDPGLPGHPLDFEAVTWFYKDASGEEKTFDFAMQVKHDMKLYPKWRSTIFINYEIRYKIFDQATNTHTDIEIAAPTYGQQLYGETITVTPKGTEEFYDAYRIEQNGYFPMTGSHSIIMGESQCSGESAYTYCTWNEETKTHIFTYYYVNGPKVPYTVKYHLVDADGKYLGKMFPDQEVTNNYMAKVVENAKIAMGYKPDAAQKTLYVLHGQTNEIVFSYQVDTTASWYTVTHYVKKHGSYAYEMYEEYRYVANIGDVLSVYEPITVPGCKYIETKVSNEDYVVREGSESTPGFWIALYYEEESVTIRYEVMGGFGGQVSLGQETVGKAYGTVIGSVASPLNSTYKFTGWYDAQGNLLSADAKYTPQKVDGVHVAATYYAKFEYTLTSLTIKKEGWNEVDSNQTFIFNVKGGGVDLDVTIHGNGSVTIDGLTVGQKYTVTEKTGWSWRYSCKGWTYGNDFGTGNSATITIDLNGTITFTNERGIIKWLDGDSWCNNIFK